MVNPRMRWKGWRSDEEGRWRYIAASRGVAVRIVNVTRRHFRHIVMLGAGHLFGNRFEIIQIYARFDDLTLTGMWFVAGFGGATGDC